MNLKEWKIESEQDSLIADTRRNPFPTYSRDYLECKFSLYNMQNLVCYYGDMFCQCALLISEDLEGWLNPTMRHMSTIIKDRYKEEYLWYKKDLFKEVEARIKSVGEMPILSSCDIVIERTLHMELMEYLNKPCEDEILIVPEHVEEYDLLKDKIDRLLGGPYEL